MRVAGASELMDTELAVAVGLAGCVALVGMPHGGLDHLFGRATLEPIAGRCWRPIFAGLYLGVGALVLAGWVIVPTLTAVLFLMISAYHFGNADGRTGITGLVEGGAVIWVPALARREEVVRVLAWVIPDGRVEGVGATLALVRPFLWAVGAVFTADLLVMAARGSGLMAVRLAAFALAYVVLPVLISFCLFFCGWHSVRELIALSRQVNPYRPWQGFAGVVRLATPRAAVAVVVTAGAAWWSSAGREPTPVMVQAVFLGLSAVAVPHILLHAAANRLGVNPFGRGVESCPIAVIT